MTSKEIIKKITDDGWYLKSIKGSHHHYIHPTKSGKVTVPVHSGDLDIKTAKSILKQAGL